MTLKQLQASSQNERGVSLVEYIFIASLIFVVCIAGVQGIGIKVAEMFENPTLRDGLTID